MFSMPLAYPSTLDRLPAKAQGRAAVVLRGGALEPDALHFPGNPQAKAHANAERGFQADAQRVFLSQAGPRFSRGSPSSWASPFLVRVTRLRKRRRRPFRIALVNAGMWLVPLAHRPPHEGDRVAEVAPVRDELDPARRTQGGLGRFGRSGMGGGW